MSEPTGGPMPADYAAEAEAMESLALAGFQLVNTDEKQENLTYVRSGSEFTDFVFLALNEGAYSMASRYPVKATPANFDEASGEVPPSAVQQAKPGSITAVIAEVLGWRRG